MGLRMESCRPWWCCSGSEPPPPGTGTGTALGPGGWPRLCRDGSPGGGGGLSSSAGLDDEWSGVPDGVFSSSELPSTDLPLPFSDAASGLWLLELEFSLFSLQVQEQGRRSAGTRRRLSAVTPGARACILRGARAPGAACGYSVSTILFLARPGALTPSASSQSLNTDFSRLSSGYHLYRPTSHALNLMKIIPALCLLLLPAPLTDLLTFFPQSSGVGEHGSLELVWLFTSWLLYPGLAG